MPIRVPDAASLGVGAGPGKIVPLQGRLTTQASPADFGAQQAQMIGGFAQDLGQAGANLWRANEAVQERDARVSANKFGLEARKHWLEDSVRREQEATPGAPGHRQQLQRDFDAYRQDAVKDLPAGLYRNLVEDDLGRLEISLGERAVAFEGQAKRSKADTDQKAALGLAGGILLTDPGQFSELLARQLKDIEGSGMPAAWKEETARTTTAALTGMMVQGLIEQEPRGTLALLESTPMPGLEADAQRQLLDRARVRVNALDADERRTNTEARAAAKVALEAANDDRVAKATDGLDPGPVATDAEWEAAHGPTWQVAKARYEDKYRRAEALGSLVGMSLPEIRQTLIDRKPNPALPGYGRQQEEYRVLVQAAAETERQIRTDPAAFAVRRSPAVAQAYQDAGGDPAKLGQAVALSLQVQREMGVPETELQPLPKQQAELEGQRLATVAEPRQQIEQVRSVLATIADPAIRRRFAASLEKDGGLPKGFTRAVDALERGDAPAAVRIMTALQAEMKIADKSTRDTVGGEIDNQIARGNLARVAQLTGQWTGDNRHLARLAEDRALAERLAAYSVSTGATATDAARQAAVDVWGLDLPAIADPNLGAVVLPEGTDDAGEQAITQGLIRARDNLGNVLTGQDVQRLIDPQGRAGVITERGAAELLEDWQDQARWINDGDGFALLVPIPRLDANGNPTGIFMQKLPGPDGKALHWTRERILTNPVPAPVSVDPSIVAPGVGPQAGLVQVDRPQFFAMLEGMESGGRNIVADDPERPPEDRAAGPMQVMPGTAREVAARMGITDLRGLDNAGTQAWMLAHPDQARAIGQHYAGEQLDRYGDPVLAAVAYTAGPDNVDTWIAQFGDPRQGEIAMPAWLAKVRAAGNPKSAAYGVKIMEKLA